MKILRYLIFLLILSGCFNSFSQSRDELKKYYENKIEVITDSAIGYNKQNADTIYLSMDTTYREMIKDFYHFKDSIMLAYRDSLNIKRKDSVNFMGVVLKNEFDKYYNLLLDSMNNVFKSFNTYLKKQQELNSDCPECKEKNNFYDKLDDYRDDMDSLSDNFEDNFNSLSDTLVAMAGDSIQGSMDALLDYTLDLVDDQADENRITGTHPVTHRETEKEPSSELDIDVTFDSHDSYRGRDNGTNEYSIAPSIQYQHKSGFGAFVDLKFLGKSGRNPDDYDAGISWQFNISDAFNIQLSYSHYWFNDSIQTRAALNNTIESAFDLQTKFYNSNLALDMDFGGGVREFSATWYHGLPLVLSKHILKGTLTFEPNLTISFGEQNKGLLALRKKRGGGIQLTLTKKSVFGIMDYEIGFPLALDTKHLIVKPQIYIIVPVNVLDASTKSAFGDFELEVTVPFSF